MDKFIVTVTRIPTNYNSPQSYIVEATSEDDAYKVVKDALRDYGSLANFIYTVKPYAPPPAGRILGVHHG
jgi:hypothetical protein